MNAENEIKETSKAKEVMVRPISKTRLMRNVKRMKKYFRQKGHSVTLGEINEAVAQFYGFKDWNAMLAIAFPSSEEVSCEHPDEKVD